MRVAAHQDLDPGPVLADALDDVLENRAHLGAGRRLAGAQDRRHGLAAARLVDVDGQEAVTVVMRVEQRGLLAAMRRVPGVVDVELDAPRHARPTVAEQIDHRRHHARDLDLGRCVLQPRHRRLRAQGGARLRRAPDRHLEHRIGAQRVAVVRVLVAGRDGEHAKAQHVGDRVRDAVGIATVGNARRQPLGDAEPALDLAQQQHAAVRRLQATRECNLHELAFDG